LFCQSGLSGQGVTCTNTLVLDQRQQISILYVISLKHLLPKMTSDTSVNYGEKPAHTHFAEMYVLSLLSPIHRETIRNWVLDYNVVAGICSHIVIYKQARNV
jgi:hypothetical protein